MKIEDTKNLKHGLCVINWNDGGHSDGVIGSQSDGGRWFAVSNWQCPDGVPGGYTEKHWSDVESVVYVDDCTKRSLTSQVMDLAKEVDYAKDQLCDKSINYRDHKLEHEANAVDLVIKGIDIVRRKLMKLDY